MEFVALSETSVQLAFWIGAASAVLTVVLLLEIAIMRFILLRETISKRRFVEQWRPLLIQAAAGEEPSLPALQSGELVTLLMLWLHLQKLLRGSASQSLNRLLARLEIEPQLLTMMREGGLDERLIAVSVAGLLGCTSAWDGLTVMVRDPLPAISITSARALLCIDEGFAVAHVIPMIVQRRDWTVGRAAVMLQEAGPIFVDAFVRAVEQAQAQGLPYLLRLMRILDILQLNRPLPFLRDMLERGGNPELLGCALRLVRDPADLDLVRRCAEHESWSVQVQAATVLGRLGSRADVTLLVSLIHSKQWWVRYRAARSLIELPFVSRSEIESIKSTMSDAFARDILEHNLAEQEAA